MFLQNGTPIKVTPGAGYGIGDDGQFYAGGCPDGVEGVNHPSGSGPLYSEEGRAALGITETADQQRPDDRFYIVHDNGDGTFSAEPKELADVAAMIGNDIQALRDSLQVQGVKVGVYWLHNDIKSRTQWERMANKSAGQPDADNYLIGGQPVPWKTMTGDEVILTCGFIRQVVDAMELQEASIFAKAKSEIAAVAAKTTVEDMIAYDWRQGWPAVFHPGQQ